MSRARSHLDSFSDSFDGMLARDDNSAGHFDGMDASAQKTFVGNEIFSIWLILRSARSA